MYNPVGEPDFLTYQVGSEQKIKFLQSPLLSHRQKVGLKGVSPSKSQYDLSEQITKSQNGLQLLDSQTVANQLVGKSPNASAQQHRSFSLDSKPINYDNLYPISSGIKAAMNSGLEKSKLAIYQDEGMNSKQKQSIDFYESIDTNVRQRDIESKSSPLQSVHNWNGSFGNHSIQSNKDELGRLYALCKEKDQIIANLMDDLAGKPSREATEAEKAHLLIQMNTMKNQIIEYENKLVLFTTENDRLNRKIQNREFELQKTNSDNAFSVDKLNIEIEEIIRQYEEKLNKILMENERLVLVNDTQQKRIDHLLEVDRVREDRMNVQGETVQQYWKSHFDTQFLEKKRAFEMEKEVIENSLKFTRSLEQETENKLRSTQSENDNLNKILIQREIQLKEIQVRNHQLEDKCSTLQDVHSLYSHGQSKIIDLESKINHLLTENSKLADISQSYEVEIRTWKQQYFEAEERAKREQSAYSNQILLIDQQRENQLRSEHETQGRLYKIIEDEKQKNQEDFENHNSIFVKLEQRCVELELEKDRLKLEINSKKTELEILSKEYERNRYQDGEHIGQLIDSVHGLQNQASELRADKQKLQIEVEVLSLQTKKNEEEIQTRKIMADDLLLKMNDLTETNSKLLIKANLADTLKLELESEKVRNSEHVEYLAERHSQQLQQEASEKHIQYQNSLEQELTLQRLHFEDILLKSETNNRLLNESLQLTKKELESSEASRRASNDHHNHLILEIEGRHRRTLEDQKFSIVRQFELDMNTQSVSLNTVIQNHEREIARLRAQIDKLTGSLTQERSKSQRRLQDLDRTCREADAWKNRMAQIDMNHQFTVEIQNQLERRRRESFHVQNQTREAIENQQSEVERVLNKSARVRMPSVDGFEKAPIIIHSRHPLNLITLDENERLNRKVLSRCREIAQQTY